MSTETGLPAGLAERLQQLAETNTTGSRPWPQLDEHFRRIHRRRVQLVSAAAALIVVAAVGLGALFVPGTLDTLNQTPASKQYSDVVNRFPELRKAGFKGPTGGDLGQDADWLQGLRTRAAELAVEPQNGIAANGTVSAADVLVLWAGDVGDTRFATVLYPLQGYWVTMRLFGSHAATPQTMRTDGAIFSETAQTLGLSHANFMEQAEGQPFVLARIPGAKSVEVASGRRFYPDGHVTTTWRRLALDGSSTVVAELTEAEEYLATLRVNRKTEMTGESDLSSTLTQRETSMLASVGGDDALVRKTLAGQHELGLSLAERPVFAGRADLSASVREALAVSVYRSPDGGHLYCFDRQTLGGDGQAQDVRLAVVGQGPDVPADQLMAVLPGAQLGTGDTRAFAVLAPAGAASVRSGPVTVPVKQRLALLRIPGSFTSSDPDRPRIVVEALDQNGHPIASVRSAVGVSEVGTSG